MSDSDKMRILVLGVGNVLLRDEGVGVRVLGELARRFVFPENVRLVDGGVLGLSLTGTIMDADHVVVIDAVRGGQPPGTVFRFDWEARPDHIHYKDSLHQIDLMETMAILPLLGDAPKLTVVGVEYEDIDGWGLYLTPKVEAAVEKMIAAVLAELDALGVRPLAQGRGEKAPDVFGGASQGN